MIVARVGSRYQVTIPKGIRIALACNYGDELVLSKVGNRISGHIMSLNDHLTGYRVRIRDRYQITLPMILCQGLHILTSSYIEIAVNNDELIMSPKNIDDLKPVPHEPFIGNPEPNEFKPKAGLLSLQKSKKRR